MSNNIKAPTKSGGNNTKPKYTQSMPANFWSSRKPPKAPKIRPLQWTGNNDAVVPQKIVLPPIYKKAHGMDEVRDKHGGFSLKSTHPMSLPVHNLSNGLMIAPSYKIKNNTNINSNENNNNIPELKENNYNIPNNEIGATSLENNMKNLQVGSYTIMRIMGGSLQAIPDDESKNNNINHSNGTRLSLDSAMKNVNNNDTTFSLDNNSNNNNDNNADIDVDGDGNDDDDAMFGFHEDEPDDDDE